MAILLQREFFVFLTIGFAIFIASPTTAADTSLYRDSVFLNALARRLSPADLANMQVQQQLRLSIENVNQLNHKNTRADKLVQEIKRRMQLKWMFPMLKLKLPMSKRAFYGLAETTNNASDDDVPQLDTKQALGQLNYEWVLNLLGLLCNMFLVWKRSYNYSRTSVTVIV